MQYWPIGATSADEASQKSGISKEKHLSQAGGEHWQLRQTPKAQGQWHLMSGLEMTTWKGGGPTVFLLHKRVEDLAELGPTELRESPGLLYLPKWPRNHLFSFTFFFVGWPRFRGRRGYSIQWSKTRTQNRLKLSAISKWVRPLWKRNRHKNLEPNIKFRGIFFLTLCI